MAQVEGVADQLPAAAGETADRDRERLGGERGHRRGAVATQRLVGQQDVEGGSTGGLDSGVGGGGVQVGPVRGEAELEELAPAELALVVPSRLEHPGGVEVLDLARLPDHRAHGTTKHRPPTVFASEALIHKANLDRELVVIWPSRTSTTTVDPREPCPARGCRARPQPPAASIHICSFFSTRTGRAPRCCPRHHRVSRRAWRPSSSSEGSTTLSRRTARSPARRATRRHSHRTASASRHGGSWCRRSSPSGRWGERIA